MKLRIIIKFLLVILWMSLIFYFSNQPSVKSTNMSDNVIITFSEVFSNGRQLNSSEKEKLLNKYVFITRKSAHFFVYFVLGILVFILLTESKKINRFVFFSTFICMLYAISDEIHQYFVYGRSCELRDIILDTSAAFISSIICFIIYRRKYLERINKI